MSGTDLGKFTPGNTSETLTMMHAITKSAGADFFAILQPNSFWDGKQSGAIEVFAAGPKNAIQKLYSDITKLPGEYNFCKDLTGILESHDGVYKADGIHATPLGDRIVAENVFLVIEDSLKKKYSTNKQN